VWVAVGGNVWHAVRAVWKAPSLGEVLRQLPFMRGESQQVIDFFKK
jgi:hypothetical protein